MAIWLDHYGVNPPILNQSSDHRMFWPAPSKRLAVEESDTSHNCIFQKWEIRSNLSPIYSLSNTFMESAEVLQKKKKNSIVRQGTLVADIPSSCDILLRSWTHGPWGFSDGDLKSLIFLDPFWWPSPLGDIPIPLLIAIKESHGMTIRFWTYPFV